MRSFAVLPLLAIFLVSLCGSPVPPPPSDVSGTVFFDANLNGMHDSCDSAPGVVTVAAYDDDGSRITAPTLVDGSFRLEDVAPGETLITMNTNPGTVWPMTTRTETGRNGVVVEVGNDDVEGVELAITRLLPISEHVPFLNALAFNDRDVDGEVDRGECSIEHAQVVDSNGVSYLPAVTRGGYEFLGSQVPDFVHFVVLGESCEALWLQCGPWQATDPTVQYCQGVKPTKITGNVFELKLGFAGSPFTGSIAGIAFHDIDRDGVQDVGEDGIPGISVQVLYDGSANDCPEPQTLQQAETTSTGEFNIPSLAQGTYHLNYVVRSPSSSLDFVLELDSPTDRVRVSERPVQVAVPFVQVPGAFVDVVVFDDNNGSGARESSESIVERVLICAVTAHRGAESHDPRRPPRACLGERTQGPSVSGAYRVGPLHSGEYLIRIESHGLPEPLSLPAIWPTVALAAGEVANVEIPMDVLSAEEQLIHTNPAAVPVEIQPCYKHPLFARPPFEAGYNGADRLYESYQIDEREAREIYGQSVFLMLSPDRYVFFEVAGIDRDATGIRDCAYDGGVGVARPDFWIVGYEVISAIRVGWTYEVVVRDTGEVGFESLSLPITYDLGDFPTEPWWVVFVDESYTPIARCSSGGCETF